LQNGNLPRLYARACSEIQIKINAGGCSRDGRALPANDPTPWWFGYSVGKYEGDTLVVETIGLRDEGWLDVQGAPFTSSAKITEKFCRPSYGRIEIDVTIDDPKAYTKPWTVRVNWRLAADEDLIEFICQENNVDEKFLK
jgi:hypothetical protein